jgi:hypothetical protein
MKTRTLSIALLGALTVACASTSGGGAGVDGASSSTPPAAPAAAPSSPEDVEAMMEAWMKLAEPGPQHAALEPMVGTFDVTMKMRMAPDAPWSESTGTSQQSWILGGRFLKQEFEANGEMGPFGGFGLLGYDNGAERYVTVWVDTWGTQIMPVGEGTLKGNVLTMQQAYDDPLTGERHMLRSELVIKSDRQHTFTMNAPALDGSGDYQNLIIEYRRR